MGIVDQTQDQGQGQAQGQQYQSLVCPTPCPFESELIIDGRDVCRWTTLLGASSSRLKAELRGTGTSDERYEEDEIDEGNKRNMERRKNEKSEDVDLTQRMSTYQKSNAYKTNIEYKTINHFFITISYKSILDRLARA